MTRRAAKLPNEYWVNWSLRSGIAGWRAGPLHWRQGDKTACGKQPLGGQFFSSVHGVRALDYNPVCGITSCKKCLRRWQKRVRELLLNRKQDAAEQEAKRWERRGRPQIRYLKLF